MFTSVVYIQAESYTEAQEYRTKKHLFETNAVGTYMDKAPQGVKVNIIVRNVDRIERVLAEK